MFASGLKKQWQNTDSQRSSRDLNSNKESKYGKRRKSLEEVLSENWILKPCKRLFPQKALWWVSDIEMNFAHSMVHKKIGEINNWYKTLTLIRYLVSLFKSTLLSQWIEIKFIYDSYSMHREKQCSNLCFCFLRKSSQYKLQLTK